MMQCFQSAGRTRVSLAVFGWGVVGLSQFAMATALDDYVAAPDDHYAFELANTIEGEGYTAYVLDLTSQQWRTSDEVDRPIWHHWLTIVVPDTAKSGTGLLFIDGGSNGRSVPQSADELLTTLALGTNTVVAGVSQVPNERLRFTDETDPRFIEGGRTEDEIIAYTFDKFMKTGDDTWPLLLPMVKSAVRAMDTVQTFVPTVTNGAVTIGDFVVSGASKRGWTTWLTGAVDSRVRAIAPVVIDVLNLDEQMVHHFAAYGFFSPAIQDYVDLNIMGRLDTPEGQAVLLIVDPYEYRDRFATMPKFMINSTGDQFFVSDSAQFYFDDLPGEKHLRYVPNTDHGLDDSDALESLLVFYQSVVNDTSRPAFTWEIQADGSIRVQTTDTPMEVNLWQATNPETRNFMLAVIGSAWTSSPLTDQGGGVYVGKVNEPAAGWTAFVVELIFDSGGSIPFKFTTQVKVVPDVLPFAIAEAPDVEETPDAMPPPSGQEPPTQPPMQPVPDCGANLCGTGTLGMMHFMLLGWLGVKMTGGYRRR